MKDKEARKLEKLGELQKICDECKNFMESLNIEMKYNDIKELSTIEKEIIKFFKKLLKISNNKYYMSKIDNVMVTNLISDLKEAKLKINNIYLNFLNSTKATNFNVQDIYVKNSINSSIYTQTFKNLFDTFFFETVKKPRFLGLFNQNPKDDYYIARKFKRHFIINFGSTNTGKTHNALQNLESCDNGIYLAPLRLLAIQVYDSLNSKNIPCNLKTGEEEILNNNAFITSATVEKLDITHRYDIAVIDEVQMINDKKRGWAWTKAILGAIADKIYICCSPNAVNLIKSIIEDLGDTYEAVEYKRNIPLVVEREKFVFPDNIQDGDALVVFSRTKALQVAASLEEMGISSSILYGSLPPESKKQQFNRFLEKKTKVLVTTDAIGMGVNLPIRRIVFLELQKFDGSNLRNLKSTEVKQIAGRAGRIGIFNEGFVNCLGNKKFLKCALDKKDYEISNAYIAPSEDILLESLEMNLYEKLNIWESSFLPVDLYKKSNISDIIYLLSILKREHIIVPQNISYKMINIPFDIKEEKLISLWLTYCENIYNNAELEVPRNQDNSLEALEIYYKGLDLYYYFVKNFNLKGIDIDKIFCEKSKISSLINSELIENLKSHKKVCKKCGKSLAWNNIYNYCDSCYTNMFLQDNYFYY